VELARARLAAIVESSDDVIISKDLNGIIDSWNRGAERIFGYTAEEAVGRSITMLIPPDRVDEEAEILARIRRGEKIDHYETVRRRKDGVRIDVSLSVSPIKDTGGAIVGASKIARDITERKQAEARTSAEAVALAKLNQLSSRLWQMHKLGEGLDEMLSATIELLGADLGNIQILDPVKGALRIAAQQGFKQDFLDFFSEVSVEDDSACGRALRAGERIIIEDVEADEPYAPLRPIARSAGYRAVQSTPLTGRQGKPLGMISTHFRHVHRPSEHDLRLLDLYARQASDFIERCETDESLRKTQRLIECQKQSLELVVGGAPLEGDSGILTFLARSMESELDGAIVAIHLMEEDGHHFGYVATPSLPPTYALATKGMDARLELGCCSSAVMSHTPTIVRDFAVETRWPAFAAEVRRIGLRGCFTTPILSPENRVLGTFAIYYREARDPSPHDRQVVDVVTRTVALAIERKQAEQSLRKSEERYKQLANLLPVAVYACDATGLITYYNPKAAELWGRAPRAGDTDERFCGSEQMILDDGQALPHDRCPMAIALRDGLSFREQPVNIRRPDGSMVSVRVNIDPIRDNAGRIVGAVNVFHDVTELRRAEQAVRNSEERYRAIVESQSEMVCRFRPDGTILFANGAYARAQGTTPDDLVGANFWSLIDAEDRQGVKELLERLSPANPQVTIENRFETAQGARWTLWTNRGLAFDGQGRLIEAQSAGIDITARKRAEEALHEHARALETLNRVNAALSAELDSQKLIQAVTDAGTELSGAKFGAFFFNSVNEQGEAYLLYTLSGAPREAFERFGIPRKTPVFAPTFSGQGVVRSDDITKDPRYGRMGPHHGMPDGHLPVRSYLAVPVVSRSGQVLGGLFFGHPEAGVFTEQSERLVRGIAAQAAVALDNARLHESLRESEERFRTMAENIPQLAWMARADGHIYWYNRRWYEYTGTTAESQAGWGWRSVHHPEHLEAVAAKWAAAVHAGELWEDTFPLRGKDGQYRWFLSRAYPIRDEQGRIIRWFGTNTDVTAQREAEEALRRHQEVLEETVRRRTEEVTRTQRALAASERMVSLGTLAAGLGHDMGNLLVPIRVRLESLQGLRIGPEVAHDLAAIHSGINYLQKLANGLRLLAVNPELIGSNAPTELQSWWGEAHSVLKSAIPRGISLEVALPDSECWVAMPRAALMQAVFNLVQNAGEAMRDRGNGTIRVAVECDEQTVRLIVSDDGPGMTPEVKSRCMEPFFTTKTRGVSTGLGLALVHGLVQQAGGTVVIEAEPGTGTAVTLRLGRGSAPGGHPAGEPRYAHLDVKDARLRAIIVNELQALNYEVRPDAQQEADADLVVSDQCRATGSHRGKLILLAEPSEAPADALALGAKPTVGAIRQALRRCAGEVCRP